MKAGRIEDFKKGWFIGNFEPSLLKADFEVAIQHYKKGEVHNDHFHKKTTEYNVVLDGVIKINEQEFVEGDIFIIKPYVVSQASYLTDVRLLVVKTESDPKDKYEFELI